ncbi:MAG: CDP-diacylglycerol--glycerol-3-phosphate 3-phosphatidyltransferase [Candidatus Faecivicinus sp.]|nr:CDP-diacylglycerol--glycerol-3-phosphate 3-phosphatidyltransferase [Candidatus Faecivicinus sp.]
MNLPNKLSMLRICMIPVFVILALMSAPAAQYAAVAVFILASITDALDGHIARKNGLVTNFGKFIDPIADKLLVMSAMIVLVERGRMPGWVCIVMLAREFAISGFRLVAAGTGKVIAAGILGKIKTVTQMIAVIALLLTAIDGAFAPLAPFADVAMYISAAMTVWSGVDYIQKNFDCIRDM